MGKGDKRMSSKGSNLSLITLLILVWGRGIITLLKCNFIVEQIYNVITTILIIITIIVLVVEKIRNR